ncbi:MAG: hypothetical protein LBC82_05385 [Oscillospiraceae bacterium]|jgi:hypothetical protein|nr:hypothetical protein [Oscillospiraceae bacterium]
MSVYEKSKRLSDKDFKQLIGVKRETFAEMVAILTKRSVYDILQQENREEQQRKRSYDMEL